MSRPRTKGAYILLFTLEHDAEVQIGQFGTYLFPAGRYAYIGSAMAGIENRVGRHLSKEKRMRWHIDHLLTVSTSKEAIVLPCPYREECRLNAIVAGLEGSSIIVPGFGSSDCRCTSHLHHLNKEAAEQLDHLFVGKGRIVDRSE